MSFVRNLARSVLCGLTLTAVAISATAQEGPADLDISKLKLRDGRKGDVAQLKLVLPPDLYLETVDLSSAPVSITLGDATIFELPPAGSRERLLQRGFLDYRYRESRRGPKLTLDLALGRVKLAARGLDLSGVFATSDKGVRVRLVIGEKTWESVVDVKRRRRVLKLRRATGPTLPPGQDPGIDIGFTVRELAGGWNSGIAFAENTVARTPTEWQALWDRHQSHMSPPAPLPDVDFTQEMVIGVFLGDRPDPSHQTVIRRVRSGEAGLFVEYDDIRIIDTNCAFPAVVSQPFALVRAPRYDTVLFSSRIVHTDCDSLEGQ